MAKHTIPIEKYLKTAQVFHWATRRHYELWFWGERNKRDRRTESVLRKLEVGGKLRATWHDGHKVYSVPRRVKGQTIDFEPTKVKHGVACTECLVRFWRSNTKGTVIAERFFYSFGSVPEWGIVYPNGKMLLFEFCTHDNFRRAGLVRSKLTAYRKNLQKIEEHFQTKAVVVFVIEDEREVVERFVTGERTAGTAGGVPPVYDGDTFPEPFYFTDYQTFLSAPVGSQLALPMYFWIGDGGLYPLSENV
jgi:hypothetical protein